MRIDVGVTGGQPNLLGSLTAAARPLPENADWHAFGTSHDPENCGKAWPWQACNVTGVQPDVQLASPCNCDVYVYAPNGGLDAADQVTLFTTVDGPFTISAPQLVHIDDNTILLNLDCGLGFAGYVITGVWIQGNAGDIYGTFADPFPIDPSVTISDAECVGCVNEIQNLFIMGDSGTYTLGDGVTDTAPIPYNANAAAVQAALETVYGVGNVLVTDVGCGPFSPFDLCFTVEWIGEHSCENVAIMDDDASLLFSDYPGAAPVDLQTAATYGVLAGTTVTNAGFTVDSGDLGIHPGAALVGFPPGIVAGATELATAAALQAKTDLTAAYIDAAGRPSDFVAPADIGGLTLVPGVYTNAAALGITGTVTLDAQGDPNAVWIFQIGSTLITAPGAEVALINGAQACNVFWQVGSSATLDTTTEFVGTILALTAITANNNANVNGRLLARNAAVTLDDNDINVPAACAAPAGDVFHSTIQNGTSAEPPTPFVAGSEKPLNPGVNAVRFKPFLAEYNAASCPGGVAVDWDQLEGRARRGLPVRTSNVLAQALSSSTINGDPNDSPNLPTLATDITPGGGPGDIVCTLAGLLQDAKDCGLTGEAFIHAPAWVLPLLLQQYLITQVGSVWKMGPHTIVLDEGFTNEAPVGSPAAAAGQAWFYITGPVEVATGSVNILTDQTRGVTVRENTANVMAAQLAIYRFDPCCVFAALVQVC